MGNGYKYILRVFSLSRVGETRLFARCHIHLRRWIAAGCLPRWWIACGIPSLTSNCCRAKGRSEEGKRANARRGLDVLRSNTSVGGKNGKGERKGDRVGSRGKKKKLWPCFSCRLHSRVISHAGNECRKYKVSWVKRGCFLFPPPFSPFLFSSLLPGWLLDAIYYCL